MHADPVRPAPVPAASPSIDIARRHATRTALAASMVAGLTALGGCVIAAPAATVTAIAPSVPRLVPANGEYAIRTSNGHYVVAEGGGGGDANANRTAIGPWERFDLIAQGNGTFALRTDNGHYLVAEGGGGAVLNANRTEVGPWEQFTFEDLGNGEVAIRTTGGQLVVAEGGGGGDANANRTEVGPWERFTLVPQ